VALFVVLIVVQHYSPKPIDWSENYNINSKSPYGCYVLNDLFDTLFPNQPVVQNNDGFFVSLDSTATEPQNLIVITPDFSPDKFDVHALLNFVKQGNTLFLASSNGRNLVLDTLNIKLGFSAIDTSDFKRGDDVLQLNHPQLRVENGFHFTKKMPLKCIVFSDSVNISVLGINRNGDTNFCCAQFGAGKIYIHTQPLVFTNYHLLYSNIAYASKVLSYLPVQKTIWDNYYKPGRMVNTSPMRYILSQPALRSAYYVLLALLLLYLLVESKRRQRIVPVVKAPENRSLEFVKTVGSLYFKQHDNNDLIKKKVVYFKEFLREHYHLTTLSNTPECYAAIAEKTGVQLKQAKQIMEMIYYFDTVQQVSDLTVTNFNHKMEQFYEQCS
jgi:hypothetical protein